MGFDTYLNVGERDGALMWRKHASVLPRLLFRSEDLHVEDLGEDGGMTVMYRSTCGQVLRNLEEAGLGWHATVAAYAAVRINGTIDGMVLGRELFGEVERSSEDARQAVEQFQAIPPEEDLRALGEFLARRWLDPDVDEVEIFDEITYDGPVEDPSGLAFKVFKGADAMEGVESYCAARATESWAVMYRDTPTLAWPVLICVLVAHLDPATVVDYDISEDANANGADTEGEAREYAAEYWASSAESLSSYAASMGRLFSALSAFDSKLGRDFWFARAADLYGRIIALQSATDDVSTKARGDLLEDLVEALMRTEEPELTVVEKNFRTREEEIDLIATNGLPDPFWLAFHSPLILVECKNTEDKIGVPDLRIFETKLTDRGALCRIGIFVSMGGFAATFLERLKTFQDSNGVIFAVTGEDLHQIITTKIRLTTWLRGPGVVKSLGK